MGPLVEGPGDVYICMNVLSSESITTEQEQRRNSPLEAVNKIPSPREIVKRLDEYVIDQPFAEVLAVAVTITTSD